MLFGADGIFVLLREGAGMRAIAFALLAIWCEYASENEPDGIVGIALGYISVYAAFVSFICALLGL